jgi:hypothetical protein
MIRQTIEGNRAPVDHLEVRCGKALASGPGGLSTRGRPARPSPTPGDRDPTLSTVCCDSSRTVLRFGYGRAITRTPYCPSIILNQNSLPSEAQPS